MCGLCRLVAQQFANCGTKDRQPLISAGRTDQGQAKRQSVRTGDSRNCQCRKVEQVDEVGVVPELAVSHGWLCLHFGDGGMIRCSRHQQYVHRLEHAQCKLPIFGKPVFRLERINCTVLICWRDRGCHLGVDRFTVGIEKGSDGSPALGHPGALVEQLRRAQQWGDVDLGQLDYR